MSVLFWLFLMLPGFALVRRFFPSQMESGLLSVIALSGLATCTILAPFAITFYLFHVPVALFSGVIVVLVLLSLLEIIRRRWWREVAQLFRGAVGIGLLILVLEWIMSARTGAFMLGDAQVHLTRIRHILDHGLNNYDPFAIPTTYLFPIYHTNLLHALVAAASQLTGSSHLDVWYASVPCGQMLVASGSYYLAWTVFQDRRAGWLAAIFVIADRGPVNFVIYPNQLAPYWLWPMLLAFVIRVVVQNSPQRHRDHEEVLEQNDNILCIAGIGAASLVMGLMHSLYVVFAGMVALPVLLVALVVSVIRRTRIYRCLVLCMLALAVGLPFALASKYMTPQVSPTETPQAFSTAPPPTGDYVHLGNSDLIMRNIGSLPDIIGGGKALTIAFLAGLICSFFGPYRLRALQLASFTLVALLILFIPFVCTPIYRALREEWVLARFEVVFSLVFFALVFPAVGMLVLRNIHSRRHEIMAMGVLSIVALLAGYSHANYESPWTWKEALADAQEPVPTQLANLRVYQELGDFAKKKIPAGSLVLIHPVTGIMLCATHDVRLVASASGSNGVPDLAERMHDLVAMLSTTTPWDERSKLLRKYNVQFFLPTAETPADWAQGHVAEVQQSGGMTLLRLTY